jgi:hypothetical protein
MYHKIMIDLEPNWEIYEFLDTRRIGVIEKWRKGVDKAMLARLHQKLDMLSAQGSALAPGLLAGTDYPHIDKLRISGPGVAWRVMICKGTVNNDKEFTILYIAQEKDRKLIPQDAYKRANDNRETLIADPSRRRIYDWNN